MNGNNKPILNLLRQKYLLIIVLLAPTIICCQPAASESQVVETPATESDLNQTKIIYCGFERARAKALEKAKRMNFQYVDDVPEGNNENSATCNATYAFYVKRIINKLDPTTLEYTNEQYVEDKIYRLNISYQKIGKEFEYVGANLYDPSRGTVQRLD